IYKLGGVSYVFMIMGGHGSFGPIYGYHTLTWFNNAAASLRLRNYYHYVYQDFSSVMSIKKLYRSGLSIICFVPRHSLYYWIAFKSQKTAGGDASVSTIGTHFIMVDPALFL